MVKIASVAMEVSPFSVEENMRKIIDYIEQAAAQNVDLLCFPELAVSGMPSHPMFMYDVDDVSYQISIAEFIPDGPSTTRIIELAEKYGMYIAFGILERSRDRQYAIYNSAVLVGPEGYIGHTQKTHQPLTERLMYHTGDGAYPVFDTPIGKIGFCICYEKTFPEISRILAIKGAEIIICPTAWPALSHSPEDPDFQIGNICTFARAFENQVIFVDSNHCGAYEMGHSRIVGPKPNQIFATTDYDEGMAVADVDVQAELLDARLHTMGGQDLQKDRKPYLYKELCKSNKFCPMSGDIGQKAE